MSNIIERIGVIIKSKDLSVRAFEMSIGASNGMIGRAISKNTDISAMWLSKIIEIYPDINTEWLLVGNGTIFNTRSTENVLNSKEDIIEGKRKVQKTSSNEESSIYAPNKLNPSIIDTNYFQYEKYRKGIQTDCIPNCIPNCIPTKSTEKVYKQGDGQGVVSNTKSTEGATIINGDKIGGKRKVQEMPPNNESCNTLEINQNYMSEMTDEEIDNVIRTQFREHLLEMVESGRYYPAIMVTVLLENQATLLNEAQKKILELELKLKSNRPPKSTKTPNTKPIHK